MSNAGIISSSGSSSNTPILIKSPLIDLKTAGSTLIFTASSNFIISSVMIYSYNLVGIADLAIGGVGTNNPSYNNFAGIALAFTATGDYSVYTTNFYSLVSGTDFYIDISVPDGTSTTNEAIVYVQGFYAF